MHNDIVIKNATIATFCGKHHVLKGASIAMKNGIITEVTEHDNTMMASKVIDAQGKLVTPGLIDLNAVFIPS